MAVTYVRNETTGEFERIGNSGITLDATLSQAGLPADAAAVGSALNMMATKDELSAGMMQASNPNLLINSNFATPVNQRNLGTYTGGAERVYTIDRWCFGNNDYERTMTFVDGGICITNPNTEYNGTFHQIFEHPLPRGNYVATVKVKSDTGYSTLGCDGSKGDITIALQPGINTLYLTDATVDNFVIRLSPSSSIILEWAKLEAGTVATPYVPKHYGEELAMCRRFYRKYSNGYFIGLAIATRDGIALAEQQEPMRIDAPTLNILSETIFNPLASNADKYVKLVSGYATVSQHTKFVSFNLGEATVGEVGRIYGSFELDAEIH